MHSHVKTVIGIIAYFDAQAQIFLFYTQFCVWMGWCNAGKSFKVTDMNIYWDEKKKK